MHSPRFSYNKKILVCCNIFKQHSFFFRNTHIHFKTIKIIALIVFSISIRCAYFYWSWSSCATCTCWIRCRLNTWMLMLMERDEQCLLGLRNLTSAILVFFNDLNFPKFLFLWYLDIVFIEYWSILHWI